MHQLAIRGTSLRSALPPLPPSLNNRGQGTPLATGLKAIDWFGCLAILGSTVMFIIGLDFGGVSFPWTSPKGICVIVFGLFMVGLFFASEAKLVKYPVMPLEIFQRGLSVAALLVCFCHGLIRTKPLTAFDRLLNPLDVYLYILLSSDLVLSSWWCFNPEFRALDPSNCSHSMLFGHHVRVYNCKTGIDSPQTLILLQANFSVRYL